MNTTMNHLIYADDLIVFTPHGAGLQQLLRICSSCCVQYITFNPAKRLIMNVKSTKFPSFCSSEVQGGEQSWISRSHNKGYL